MIPAQVNTGIYIFTTEKIERFRIVEYYGMVTGHSVMGANFIKDFFARISDTVGGRVGGYERAVDGALNAALEQMAVRARNEGANAVIGVDADTTAVGPRMLMASCYGTAVLIEQIDNE